MKSLYLLRHGKSDWDADFDRDRDRPISGRGRKAARKIARLMKERGIRPDIVLCSDALRTRQTIGHVLDELGWPQNVVRYDERLYLAAVDSLYVVGDVHGEFDRLLRLLRSAGLVDAGERWTGGTAHLVLLGDVFDRGPDVTRALWFLYGLEAEAREAGGRVHLVLGNHEIMVLTRDLRYVSRKERSLADLRSTTYTRLFDLRRSVLGQWLAARPAVLRIGPVLLAHGGLAPPYADASVGALDDTLAAYVSGDVFRHWSDSTVEATPVDSAALARRIDFFFGEESVFWHRGYVEGATGLSYGSPPSAADGPRPPADDSAAGARADSLSDLLGRVLRRHDSRLHVVAHTPLPRIQQGFGGRLIGVDLRRAASEMLLLVRDGEAYRRYRLEEEGAVTRLEASPPDEP